MIKSREARKLADQMVRKLEKELSRAISNSPVAQNFYDCIGDLMELLATNINEVSQILYGHDIATKGRDYWHPTIGNSTESMIKKTGRSFALEEMGLLQRREGYSGTIRILPATDALSQYINSATDFVAFGELTNELELMNKDYGILPSLGSQFEQAYGRKASEWLDTFIDDLNNNRKSGSSFLSGIRKNIASSALLANPGVALKQSSSYWNFAGSVDMGILVKARFMNGNLLRGARGWSKNGTVQEVNRLTKFLESRGSGYISTEIGDMTEEARTLSGRLLKTLPNFVKNWITKQDYSTAANGMIAVAEQVKRDRPDLRVGSEEYYQEVAYRFEDAILNSQAVFVKQYRAEYQRNPDGLARGLSMFRSQPTTNLNYLMTTRGEYLAAQRNGDAAEIAAAKKTYTTALSGQILSNISYGLLSAAVKFALKPGKFKDDEEDKVDLGKLTKTAAFSVLENAAGLVWFGDTLAAALIDAGSGALHSIAPEKFDKTEEFYGLDENVLSVFGDVADALMDLADKRNVTNFKNVVATAGQAAGLPIRNMYNMANALAMWHLDATGNNPRNYTDAFKLLDDWMKWDDTKKAGYIVDKAILNIERNDNVDEAVAIMGVYDDSLGFALHEAISSEYYKALTKEQQTQDGYKNVRISQKYKAIDEYDLSDEEKWAAFFAVATEPSHIEQGMAYYSLGVGSYSAFARWADCCNPK